ncbi:hypothetical protein J1N35_020410 [Gossypium stocksii]|uniref:Uncharacterized protein n=1 Tax=Gossypium stocksii TaxID=47602 RepID=A0A9D4A1F2_9ROSI|nr:hypothetical protein J1N35_020410 [Gossypium stocksii]
MIFPLQNGERQVLTGAPSGGAAETEVKKRKNSIQQYDKYTKYEPKRHGIVVRTSAKDSKNMGTWTA